MIEIKSNAMSQHQLLCFPYVCVFAVFVTIVNDCIFDEENINFKMNFFFFEQTAHFAYVKFQKLFNLQT